MCRLSSTTNASPPSWRADPGARRPKTPARPPYSWRDGWLADAHMNPTQTPPRSRAAAEAPGHDGPLDSFLTQIIAGFFVLTDGQGPVSKWSEPAELCSASTPRRRWARGCSDTLVDYMHSQGLMVAVAAELTP